MKHVNFYFLTATMMRAAKGKLFVRILFSCALFFSCTAHAAETRALKIIATDPATQQTGEVTLYNKTVAVIIGIDQYAHLPQDKQLKYAVHDAQGVADVLKRQYKFDQIVTLYDKDATRKAITKLLEVDLPKQLGKEDALFIFWAGHGNQESSSEGDIGYLIPHDGDPEDITSNLTMSEIRDTVSKKISAKHIFYVMDACYSGLLTETRSVDKTSRRDLAYLQDISKERVRQVLTAGSKNQEVLDGGTNGHSVFTGRLIELLEKTGDFITANEIQAIIKEKVNGDARARNHQQTPSYGTLYGSGDFVFIPSLEQKVADNKAEIAKLEAEQKEWERAQAAAKLAGNQAEIDRLKRDAEIAKKAIEGKLKIQQLKQDELAAEEKRREAEAAEHARLMAAKNEDDKKIAELKAAADARRKNIGAQTGNFPTVESAVAEIKRLYASINAIEAGYEKELAQPRQSVSQRYAAQLDALNKVQRDEFETEEQFKAKQGKQRAELVRQRDAELSRLTATSLAAAETSPLRDSLKALSEREYVLGAENFTVELGAYDVNAQQFTISLRSKTSAIKLAMNGSVSLPPDDAKVFKQQWGAGLVRPECKVKIGGNLLELSLVRDADNSHLLNVDGVFMTFLAKQAKEARVLQEKQRLDAQEKYERTYRPAMITIPAKSGFLSGSIEGFQMSATEITLEQWLAVVDRNRYSAKGDCGNCPVTNIDLDGVKDYLAALNEKTHGDYRLPTQDEWEYACQAGGSHQYCGSDNVDVVAWYEVNSGEKTHPVAQKQANAFGLYDMSGNVSEWTSSCYEADCFVGGGSYTSNANDMQLEKRYILRDDKRGSNFGFRVVRTLPKP